MSLHARVLICAAFLATICYAVDAPADWQTYRSPDYRFSIKFPADMTLYPGRPDLAETHLSSAMTARMYWARSKDRRIRGVQLAHAALHLAHRFVFVIRHPLLQLPLGEEKMLGVRAD